MSNIFNEIKAFFKALLLIGACCTQALHGDCRAPSNCSRSKCCPSTCGAGFISADLLYWRAYQGGLADCVTTEIVERIKDGHVFSEFKGKEKDLHYRWRPGFRIGVGYLSPDYGWDVAAYWTSLHSRAEGDHSHSQRLHWKLNFEVVDLLVGYDFDINPCLTVRPFCGLRGAYIDQSIRRTSESDKCLSEHDKERRKQKFYGIGPLLGIGAELGLKCGFSLYADVAASVLYGNYNLNFRKFDKFKGNVNLCRIKGHQHECEAVVDAGFGISWQKDFCNDTSLVLSLGVEHHCYFNHNRLGKYGNLCLDGGTFSAVYVF